MTYTIFVLPLYIVNFSKMSRIWQKLKKCYLSVAIFMEALLLTVLAYNVGHSCLLGNDKCPKSNLIKKIESDDRDFYEKSILYRCYKGKPIPSIERRRKNRVSIAVYPIAVIKESSLKQLRESSYCKTQDKLKYYGIYKIKIQTFNY